MPLRRWGIADDVAAVVSFLASPRSAYMTTGVLQIDGGVSLRCLLRPSVSTCATRTRGWCLMTWPLNTHCLSTRCDGGRIGIWTMRASPPLNRPSEGSHIGRCCESTTSTSFKT
ncbi:SDR family oxidoreductase [Rhodococcus sp. AG1013]|uniref:SDR family oxidoreductase n=1 Tax=Rhodococcus sp. AG1013 TaxID=2183996 RepID=UPI000E0BC7AC